MGGGGGGGGMGNFPKISKREGLKEGVPGLSDALTDPRK